MSTGEQNETPQADRAEIPKAVVRTAEQVSAGRLKTRLWWLTLLCVGLAAALVVSSYQTQGTTIAIHFDQGHGLKAGDTLRYRGIDVGVPSLLTKWKRSGRGSESSKARSHCCGLSGVDLGCCGFAGCWFLGAAALFSFEPAFVELAISDSGAKYQPEFTAAVSN